MQDRFKFRAYNTVTKEFIENVNSIGDYSDMEDDDGKNFHFKGIKEKHTTLYTAQLKTDWVIMQCTGLKDKNGKLIFEGDILRYPAKDDWSKKNFCAREVFWHDNDCSESHIGWQMGRVHCFGNLAGENINPFDYQFKPKNVSNMEIIGNIYENPELLEAGNQ